MRYISPTRLQTYTELSARQISAYLLLVGLMFLASISNWVDNLVIGQIVIIIYGVGAMIARISSATNFKAAFIALALVPVLSFFDISSDLLQAFSTFGYVLLVIALVSGIAEYWRE